MHKYLDEVDQKPFFHRISRHPKHWKQKIKYGFTSRETWDLDYTFYCWLYERLRMYMDEAKDEVDLTFHKHYFKGKEYTEEELLNQLINRLKYYFKVSDCTLLLEREDKEYIEEIGKIWAILLPSMWW